MKFLCLISAEKMMEDMPAADAESHFQEYAQFTNWLKTKGHFIGANRLKPASTATTVRVRDGKTVVKGTFGVFSHAEPNNFGNPITFTSPFQKNSPSQYKYRFVDANGAPFGSFDLDPGEAVDAHVNSDGSVDAIVLQGTVTITVRDEAVTLQAGDEHAFPPIEIQIAIDIKPGDSTTNPINLKANGVIPIAILSDARFDARTADPASLRFSGASVARTPGGAFQMSVADVNGDGRFDIVVQFETRGLLLTPADTVGVVTGQTANGLLFRGIDAVRVK